MSLRTKINGFTAWMNLRLTPYKQLLNNVLMDLLSGTNLKYFVESFTGRELKRLENMDGLTDMQRQTRMDWVVEELKKCNVIPADVKVDTREFAMRSSDHVFDLLWRLISHDIWFVWERAEYLQVEDLDVLTQVPFKWTPDPPPRKKKSKKKAKQSLLSGFGTPVSEEKPPEDGNSAATSACQTNDCLDLRSDDLSDDLSDCSSESIHLSDSESDLSYTDADENDSVKRKRHKHSNRSRKGKRGHRKINNFLDLAFGISNAPDHIMNETEESGMTRRIVNRSFMNHRDNKTITLDEANVSRNYDNELFGKKVETDHDASIQLNKSFASDIDHDETIDVTAMTNESDVVDDRDYSRVHVYIEPLKDDSEDSDNETDNPDIAGRSSRMSIQSIDNLDLDWRVMSTYNETLDYTAFTSIGRSSSQWSVNTQYSEGSDMAESQISGSRSGSRLSSLSRNVSYSQSRLSSRGKSPVYTKTQFKTQEQDFSLQKSLQPFKLKDSSDVSGRKHSTSPGFLRVPSENTWSRSVNKRRQSTPYVGTENQLYTGSGEIWNQSESFQILDNVTKDTEKQDDDEKWIKFPNAEYVKGFKKKKRDKEDYPSPDECILELVNYQLKYHFSSRRNPLTRDGKGLYCYTQLEKPAIKPLQSIDDFVDSRVLCALVNSFVPNTFTADLLLNDRWTINLALKTAEKMFYAETPFDAEDLVEADPMAVCAYFAFFLMVAYRYRQTTAVVNRVDFINMLIRECNHDLDKFPPIISNMAELQRRKDLKNQLDQHRQALENLQKKFDVEFSRKWVQHVEHVQNELRRDIREKMRHRFDVVEVPRNITINDFCLAAVINLSLTNGSGFYMSTGKETLSDGRKLVLRNTDTGEYIDDFTNRSRLSIKDALGVSDMPGQVIELNPQDFPQYEFYFEAQSRNKQLRTGGFFLYQVFPGNTVTWQRLFIKSAREAEYETVEKMIMFFREDRSFINCREPKSGNTALHYACKMGHFDVVRLLLENNASIDAKNLFKCSPINLAAEALQRRICHYLIEWGSDVTSKNVKGQGVLETIKNDDFKRFCIELYDHYSNIVPKIMTGDMELLDCVIADHVAGIHEFCCLRSRCINGSTLLHTASYYGYIPAIKELLAQRVDVNLRDYKGATPLHRAKNPDVMELLLEAGAHVNSEDTEGNTPLHVKCYGETNKPSETECIQMLLNKNANLTIRNSRGLLPIHCCAMQGRIDVMQQMMKHDQNNSMALALSKENLKKPPSLLNLAIANDFVNCAEWLLENNFRFKDKEQDILLRRILTDQIKLNKRVNAVKFLLDNGADPNPKYPGGNSALHYAASLSGTTDVLELLISYRSEIDCLNEEKCTPLFFATQSNNQYAACILIGHGASVRQKSSQGMTAFDYIVDFEEWINCGYFSEEVMARLKAYNLKHARDLIRAISKKVKPSHHMRPDMARAGYPHNMATPGLSPNYRMFMTMSSLSQHVLPPLQSRGQKKYVTY